MNVTYKCKDGNAIICADGGEVIMPSYEQLEDLLVYENLRELIRYLHDRDRDELVYLNNKKDNCDKACKATGAYAIGSSVVAPLLALGGVIKPEVCGGFTLGVLSTTAAIIALNKQVFSRNKARLGLKECINYEEKKYEELGKEIYRIKSEDSLIYDDVKETIVDDRLAKKRFMDVMEFVFYLGGNRDKVFDMYQGMTLHRFLKEKMGITDVKTIIEIESYVFCTFEDEIKKNNSYVKKSN